MGRCTRGGGWNAAPIGNDTIRSSEFRPRKDITSHRKRFPCRKVMNKKIAIRGRKKPGVVSAGLDVGLSYCQSAISLLAVSRLWMIAF